MVGTQGRMGARMPMASDGHRRGRVAVEAHPLALHRPACPGRSSRPVFCAPRERKKKALPFHGLAIESASRVNPCNVCR